MTDKTSFRSSDTAGLTLNWEVIVGVEITGGVEMCDMTVAGTGFDTDRVAVKPGVVTR